MRVAEIRAVNRALRKAYGIGICSVEEIGSLNRQSETSREQKRSPQPANGNGYGAARPRSSLSIDSATSTRRHAGQVVRNRFLWRENLREATREQVENFVAHLADWAEKDRDAVLCQLNSYLGAKEGVA